MILVHLSHLQSYLKQKYVANKQWHKQKNHLIYQPNSVLLLKVSLDWNLFFKYRLERALSEVHKHKS